MNWERPKTSQQINLRGALEWHMQEACGADMRASMPARAPEVCEGEPGGPSVSGCMGAAARMLRRCRSGQAAGSLDAAPTEVVLSRWLSSEAWSPMDCERMAGCSTCGSAACACSARACRRMEPNGSVACGGAGKLNADAAAAAADGGPPLTAACCSSDSGGGSGRDSGSISKAGMGAAPRGAAAAAAAAAAAVCGGASSCVLARPRRLGVEDVEDGERHLLAAHAEVLAQALLGLDGLQAEGGLLQGHRQAGYPTGQAAALWVPVHGGREPVRPGGAPHELPCLGCCAAGGLPAAEGLHCGEDGWGMFLALPAIMPGRRCSSQGTLYTPGTGTLESSWGMRRPNKGICHGAVAGKEYQCSFY